MGLELLGDRGQGFVPAARQVGVDEVAGGIEDADLEVRALREIPPVDQNLVIDLGLFELAPIVGWHHRHDRLVDVVHPAGCHQHPVLATQIVRCRERRDVVEQAPRLVVLHRETGEPLQFATVVTEFDDPGLDPDRVAVEVGDDVELVDVEAEVVETLNPLLDAPHLRGRERLFRRQFGPQCGVPCLKHFDHLERTELGLDRIVRSHVEEFGEHVLGRDGHVVVAHPFGERWTQLPGLGVHEVRRESPRRATEQHVRQRHVTPIEAGEMEPHQQHHHRVDQQRHVVGGEAPGEQAAIGQGEGQMFGDQGRREFVALGIDPTRHNRLRRHSRQADPVQVSQQTVLPGCHRLLRLLDGVHLRAQPDDAHDVPRQAARQGHDVLIAPLLERCRPGQPNDRRIGAARDDPEGHGSIIPHQPVDHYLTRAFRGSDSSHRQGAD